MQPSGRSLPPSESVAANQANARVPLWRRVLGGTKSAQEPPSSRSSVDEDDGHKVKPEKWSMGVLNDKQTDEVPGMSRVQCYLVFCTLPVDQQHQEIRCWQWANSIPLKALSSSCPIPNVMSLWVCATHQPERPPLPYLRPILSDTRQEAQDLPFTVKYQGFLWKRRRPPKTARLFWSLSPKTR